MATMKRTIEVEMDLTTGDGVVTVRRPEDDRYWDRVVIQKVGDGFLIHGIGIDRKPKQAETAEKAFRMAMRAAAETVAQDFGH